MRGGPSFERCRGQKTNAGISRNKSPSANFAANLYYSTLSTSFPIFVHTLRDTPLRTCEDVPLTLRIFANSDFT